MCERKIISFYKEVSMRARVVLLTSLFSLTLSLAIHAEGNQLQPLSKTKQTPPSAPLTSNIERYALHESPDWALIAPHLPDPQTATAARLEMAGDILMARRFPEDALDYYGYAMARGGNVSVLLNKMGVVRLELRQPELAREMFLRTVRAQKKNAAAWNNLGVAEYQEKRYQNAAGDYQKASHLDRRSAVYHSNLAMVYFEMKNMEDAQRQFSIAVRLDPKIMDPAEGFGAVAHVMGSADYAGLCFEMATMFAGQHRPAEMRRWLAKASEGGYDVHNGMQAEVAFRPYLKDLEVKQILINSDLLRKKTVASVNIKPLQDEPAH
jgi:tetratricopeptide (TPR) repeat protein